MTYPISTTPTYLVDHEHLSFLDQYLREPGASAVVVGFGEYAKHLVNLHREKIRAVYDPEPWRRGITFRDVPVVDVPDTIPGVNVILMAEYELAFDYLPRVLDIYPGVPHRVPPRMNYKNSNDVNVFEQEGLYKALNRIDADAPPTMMSKEKIRFLIEMMRFGLKKPGCVLEMGSWQGGSTWYMAQVLASLGETRTLYMMDLFEQHMMDPTATMCLEEIRRRMSVYAHTQLIVGLVDDPACLQQVQDQQICFAHMDLGPQPVALDFIWEHLAPGAPLLLDNYGHLAAPPWAFDRYIESKGSRIIRLPWSEQGLTFKTC